MIELIFLLMVLASILYLLGFTSGDKDATNSEYHNSLAQVTSVKRDTVLPSSHRQTPVYEVSIYFRTISTRNQKGDLPEAVRVRFEFKRKSLAKSNLDNWTKRIGEVYRVRWQDGMSNYAEFVRD